jgi:hypothetical protein
MHSPAQFSSRCSPCTLPPCIPSPPSLSRASLVRCFALDCLWRLRQRFRNLHLPRLWERLVPSLASKPRRFQSSRAARVLGARGTARHRRPSAQGALAQISFRRLKHTASLKGLLRVRGRAGRTAGAPLALRQSMLDRAATSQALVRATEHDLARCSRAGCAKLLPAACARAPCLRLYRRSDKVG